MKKNELPLLIASFTALVVSIVSVFLPFLSVKYYKSVSGIKLIFSIYRRFKIQKTSSEAYEDLWLYSYSLPLLITIALAVVSIVLIALYVKKGKASWLNYSVLSVTAAAVALAVQLSNSNTMVSDFFGSLSQSIPATGGQTVYQVADCGGIDMGLGAKIFTVCIVLALLCILVAKLVQHTMVDRSQQLQTPMSIAYRQFKKNKLAIFGLFVILFLVLVCFYGTVFSNYAMLQTNIDIGKVGPSLAHLFGTDIDGRDVLTCVLYGGRVSIEIGFAVVLIEVIVGTIIGGIAGFYGGWVDNLLMRFTDIFLCLPFWPIMLIIAAVMMDLGIDPSKRIYFIMIVLGLLFWPPLARLVRGQILSLREQEYIVAAEALGIRDRKRIFKHLVPNALPNIIVTATLDVGNAILTESALSFLGLGVATPYPSWGNIVSAVNDANDFAMRPWLWVPAGVCILITVLAINFVGDGLRDAFDPKMKR